MQDKVFVAVAKHVLPIIALPNCVYVGRTRATGKMYPLALHQLANPYHIGEHGTREEVVRQYREWLFQRIQIGATPIRFALLKLLEMAETTGVVLVCHCTDRLHGGPLGDECHAQVVAKALAWMAREKNRTGFYPTCKSYWDQGGPSR